MTLGLSDIIPKRPEQFYDGLSNVEGRAIDYGVFEHFNLTPDHQPDQEHVAPSLKEYTRPTATLEEPASVVNRSTPALAIGLLNTSIVSAQFAVLYQDRGLRSNSLTGK